METRRSFLKQAAAGVAVPWAACSAGADEPESLRIPPHLAVPVPGVHAYADRESVLPGESLHLFLSNEPACEGGIYRLGDGIDSVEADRQVHTWGRIAPNPQAIHPGSYAVVSGRLGRAPRALSLECWVRPWSISQMQGLLTQEDKDSDEGFALGIGKGGYVGFYLGNGVGPDEVEIHRSAPGAVTLGQWSHVVGVWDGHEKQLWVDGVLKGVWPFAGPFKPGRHPLRLAAMGQKGQTLRFLDGDLAMCAIYTDALTTDYIRQRYQERGLKCPVRPGLWAAWDFQEERGDRLADVSGNGREARLINEPTWMVGGPSLQADIDRFAPYDPAHDATRGHGLRFASDDLHDCGWRASLSWRAPEGAEPGLYVARFRYQGREGERLCHVPFVVRRPRSAASRLLVLCSTNTWRAYNAAPFGSWPASLAADIGTDGLPNPSPDLPAFSFYRGHRAGQGSYKIGRRMPWPAGSPYAEYGHASNYSHLLRAERYLHAWLEKSGYSFDLATDLDLHFEPDLLVGRSCVVLNGHSEYWSMESREAVERYLGRGGNLAILSGNSVFWRVSHSPDGRVMECRKVDAPGFQVRHDRRGECWHSDDGLRGGLLRDCGFPGWSITGLECLGWNDTHKVANFGPYETTLPSHFLFQTPEPTGLGPGAHFGYKPGGTESLANGHEIDIRLGTLRSMQEQPNPAGGVLPDDPAGITVLAQGMIPWPAGGSAFDFFFREIHPRRPQGAEMIYWERPAGGRVFNAGSIGAGWAIYHDPAFGKLFGNVLHHFGVGPGAGS